MVEKNDLRRRPLRTTCADDLPPEGTQRWVACRKAQVVAAVREGGLGFEDACRRYNISHEEYASWERAIDRHVAGPPRDPAAGVPLTRPARSSRPAPVRSPY